MANGSDEIRRQQTARIDDDGKPIFSWTLTDSSILDTVRLTLPSTQSLPIVFVPGIMGSNLCTLDEKPVWLLNSTRGQPVRLAWHWARKGAGDRQKFLHPARTKVFRGGNVPSGHHGTIWNKAGYVDRGWGEVGETSYHQFLLWLEEKMNGQGSDPATWTDFYYTAVSAPPKAGSVRENPKLVGGITMQMTGLPQFDEEHSLTAPVVSDELIRRSQFRFPIYAFGYNWLDTNSMAAQRLEQRIDQIIAENNRGIFKCEQVILVTHSMGGLVARACVSRAGVRDKVAGVVHGVMPSVGAAVAYRRCKVGMKDEDFGASLVIGPEGREVTAVFSQAPGALQLLPSEEYGPDWLQLKDENGKLVMSLPKKDPYTEIYLNKDSWWGLVYEDWLRPEGGVAIKWDVFEKNIERARTFHNALKGKFHPQTYVFYGASNGLQASFEKVTWTLKRGINPGKGGRSVSTQVPFLKHSDVRESGGSTIYVGGESVHTFMPDFSGSSVVKYETSFWEIQCQMQDGIGDGTVPSSSGRSPRKTGGSAIRQQFRLYGFSHEPAYKDTIAQCVTQYAITKICSNAKAR